MNIIQRLFPCVEKIREANERNQTALANLAEACDNSTCGIVTPPPFDERHIINRTRQ